VTVREASSTLPVATSPTESIEVQTLIVQAPSLNVASVVRVFFG
jgi:hypothetical protein